MPYQILATSDAALKPSGTTLASRLPCPSPTVRNTVVSQGHPCSPYSWGTGKGDRQNSLQPLPRKTQLWGSWDSQSSLSCWAVFPGFPELRHLSISPVGLLISQWGVGAGNYSSYVRECSLTPPVILPNRSEAGKDKNHACLLTTGPPRTQWNVWIHSRCCLLNERLKNSCKVDYKWRK